MEEPVNGLEYVLKIIDLNDRRYSEVNTEREKALKIKEEADKAALGLAREIQTYKDEQANRLREQINNERGTYATKDDLVAAMREITQTVKPLAEYVSSQQGRSGGIASSWGLLVSAIVMTAAIVGLLVRLTGG